MPSCICDFLRPMLLWIIYPLGPGLLYSLGSEDSRSEMELIVYSSSWCPDCRIAKRFLAKHNVSYQEVDIEETPGAAQEILARTGKRAIPQFVINGVWVEPYRPGEGFLYEEMSQLLGISDETAAND